MKYAFLEWAVDGCLAFCTVTWGLNNVLIKYTLGEVSTVAFNVPRFVFATVLLLGFLQLTEHNIGIDRADIPKFLWIGFLGHGIYQVFYINGINLTTAGKTSVLLSLQPEFVAFYEHFLGKRANGWLVWAGMGVSFFGVTLVSTAGRFAETLSGGEIIGDILVLAATGCWAGYSYSIRPLLNKYSSLKVTAVTMAVGTSFFAILSLPVVVSTDWSKVPGTVWLAILLSGGIAVSLNYVIWGWGIQKIGSARTAIYQNLNPASASLAGWALLGEKWVPVQIAGAALILFGVFQVRAGRRVEKAVASRSLPPV